MANIVFRVILDDAGVREKLIRITDEAEIARLKIEDPASLRILTTDARWKIRAVQDNAKETKEQIETPAEIRISTTQALGTIRDLNIAVQGVIKSVQSLTNGINSFLDSALIQRQAEILTAIAFRSAADEMKVFASAMQSVTNYGDEALLPLIARLSQTFKVSAVDVRALTPLLIDFAEANKAAGMTLETAFNLFGRALDGNTAMLSRYGISLDDTRLKTEGVSYLVEKLTADYGGTAAALADLRIQNMNTWGDIKETLGSFLDVIINPILQASRWLMEAWQSLPPVLQGLTAGIALAIPVISTLAVTITTLATAIVALKAVINPIAGIISLVAGAATIGAFSYAAYAASTRDAADAAQGFADTHLSVEEAIADANRQVSVQSEKFNLLAARLLELKSATNLTAQEKIELKNIIQTLNSTYGEYLSNIDLETSSYDRLVNTLKGVSENLLNKQITEIYGERYQAQLRKVAELQVKYNELLEKGVEFMAPKGMHPPMIIDTVASVSERLEAAKTELSKFATAYSQALADITNLSFEVPVGDATGTISSEAQKLMDELANLRLSETQRIEAEYQRRSDIISAATQKDSAAQTTALENLNAWKESEDNKIEQKHIADTQNLFRADIDYYSNLNSLGVSSYDALKSTMEAYYEWAKTNLPEKERNLILAQLKEANLRHGLHEKEKRDRIIAEAQAIEDIQDAFLRRSEGLENDSYSARIREINRFFERKKEEMIKAGISEAEITEQNEKMILDVKAKYAEAAVKGVSSILGNLAASQDKETKKGFNRAKTLSMMQATIDTFASANAAYKAMVGIPVVGPALAIAAAAAAILAGMQNVANIKAMEFRPPQAATGGLLSGPSHARGGVLIEAEGDEYIIARERVRTLGKSFFDFLNFEPLSKVKSALSSLALPPMSFPSAPAYAFASGGAVPSSSPVVEMLSQINKSLIQIIQQPTHFDIHVDPLSNDPVKISEIADRGKIIRSEI